VQDNPVVVITAETGAGKSTQVPQYLFQEGYEVVVTQPRRLAARMIANRVASELETSLGDIVGFHTGEERRASSETKVLFCTDGLHLVRELTGSANPQQVLVIDEVHEWNLNIETLVAWTKFRLTMGESLKVVLMSATVDAGRLSTYFNDCPIIEVPGRLHPVTRLVAVDVADTIAELAQRGRNILAFLPGKSEIDRLVEDLKRRKLDQVAEILPLHSDLNPSLQDRAFQAYTRPKVVVSTNVAQTSLTIEDIDAVVDSGLEKRVEVRQGIEGLHVAEISQADCDQRAGRAGRVKPGMYVLCSQVPYEDRPHFATAEVERTRLEQIVLRLADVGFDASELDFFHQPAPEALADASEALRRLQALDNQGIITEVGEAMVRLPVDVHLARMIVEAQRLGVAADVITIAACLETGGIRRRSPGGRSQPTWKRLTTEDSSDLLAELDCFDAASRMPASKLFENGIHDKNYHRAVEIQQRLLRRVEVSSTGLRNREAILKASVTGMVDHIYKHDKNRLYRGAGGQQRQLDRNSVVYRAAWVTGLPFDIGTHAPNGQDSVRRLIKWVSRVDPSWVGENVTPEPVGRPKASRTGYARSLDELESALGTRFQDPGLLEQALTHRSYLNEARGQQLEHNERLEFLGDAVLELVVTDYLYEHYQEPEGVLTNWRSALVKTESLGKVAETFGLSRYLTMSRGQTKGNERARVLMSANAVEAIIGALYRDQGLASAAKFIYEHIISRLPTILEDSSWVDPKSQLQEVVQSEHGLTPTYQELSASGPDHDRTYVVGVFMGEKQLAVGRGSSLKSASQDASANAMAEHFAHFQTQGRWLPVFDAQLDRPQLHLVDIAEETELEVTEGLSEIVRTSLFLANASVFRSLDLESQQAIAQELTSLELPTIVKSETAIDPNTSTPERRQDGSDI
jgi:ribonuclease III